MAENNSTFGHLLDQMRQALRPKGTADAVILRLGSSSLQALVLTDKEVQDAINEFAQLALMAEKASPLQRIAIQVLMDSAYLTRNPDDHHPQQQDPPTHRHAQGADPHPRKAPGAR